MYWTWDETKNRINQRKHKMPFEIAVRVFDDPFAISRSDVYPHEERWQTMGMIGNRLVLVVHTAPIYTVTGEIIGRIISARKPTRYEKRAYEEGEF